MALHLQQDTGSGFVDVDLTTAKIAGFKFDAGYGQPATLSFVVHQPHHTTPIPPYAGIRFWDDAGTDPDGNAYSADNPLFLGFAEDVEPGNDGHTVNYVCFDVTARAQNMVQIMSTAWADATTPGTGAVPRLVYNSTIDNDDDYAFCRSFNVLSGQIIGEVLDDARPRLKQIGAAPLDDSAAYEIGDLNGMLFETQEKIVFQGEGIRGGIDRVLNDWEPEWRMLFDPGSRRWRFRNIYASTVRTVTLNDFTADNPVLQVRVQRSLADRYTAVKIYGPEALQNREVTLSGGGLIDVSDGPVIDRYGAGAIVRGKNMWQIADATRRRMGRLLPVAVDAPSPSFRWAPNAWTQYSTWTRDPVFMVRYKYNSGGLDVWQTMTGWTYDGRTGIISFKNSLVYRYNPNPEIEGGILQPNYENPEDVRLIYPSFIDPLSVRVPASGFEGTAFTDYGLDNELAIYDEMLAVGFMLGTAVTSATRLAKFQVLAQSILNSKKDVTHTGGVTLQGLDYRFAKLNTRLNIDGVDGAGGSITTGWESLNAMVTDVEYDYENQTTTLQFSSDYAELSGYDPAQTKSSLKIGAAQLLHWIEFNVDTRKRRAFTEFGTPVIGVDIAISATPRSVVVDPYLGTVDNLLYNN